MKHPPSNAANADQPSTVLPLIPVADTTDMKPGPNNRRQRWVIILSTALLVILTVVFYRQALDFAYFNDDPTGHFAWMEGKSTADFFLSSADYGYYRPVVFATLRTTETLFGGHVPAADHALLLLLHAANVAMVWLLAYRLSRKQIAYAWVAALAFLAMPFNYEAVIYVASLTHPLLLFWLLITLHLYIWGRAASRRGPLVMAWIALVLGLLTHENGLIVLPALAGVEWVVFRPKSWRQWLKPLWPFALPVLLYIPLWLAIPKDNEAVTLSFAAVRSNTVPFLQSLVYPLLPLLSLEAGDVGSLFVVALLFLGITALMARRSAAFDLWLFALGWVVLSALPAMLFLNPDYLYGSPRLSYLPSVGIALLWGIPVLWLWREPLLAQVNTAAREVVRIAAAFGLILLIAVPPQSFIRCEMDFYRSTSEIVRAMADTAEEVPPDKALAFVNLPFFFSSSASHPDGCPSPYPWIPVGAVVVPPYAQVRDFVRFNDGPDREVTAVTYEGYNAGWRTVGEPVNDQALRALVETSQVQVFDLFSQSLVDLNAIWQTAASSDGPSLASFGETIDLVAAEIGNDPTNVAVQLSWRVTEPPAAPLAVFVHLYGPDGVLIAQADSPPGRGFVPTSLWQTGDQISDAFQLDFDRATQPQGDYFFRIGVYDPQTGTRLLASSHQLPVADDAVEIGRIDTTNE